MFHHTTDGPHVTVTHDTMEHGTSPSSPCTPDMGPTLPPSPGHYIWDLFYHPCYWHLVVITGDLEIKLVYLMATKTCTVGNRVVHILLECILVFQFDLITVIDNKPNEY